MTKHPEAEVWDNFILSEKGKELRDATTLNADESQSQYLENRLHTAFRAGLEAGKELKSSQVRRRIVAKMFELVAD